MIGFIDLIDLVISNIQDIDIETIEQIALAIPKTQVGYYSELLILFWNIIKTINKYQALNF